MQHDPYKPPESVVTAAGHRPGSPTKAVLVGSLVNVIGSLVAGIFIGIAAAVYFAAVGYTDEQISDALMKNTGLILVYFFAGIAFSILAGYLCARIANVHEYRYAFITGVIGYAIGELMFMIDPSSPAALPRWYLLASYLLYLPAVLLGAYLWVQRKAAGEPATPC
jgi:MFS family permease